MAANQMNLHHAHASQLNGLLLAFLLATGVFLTIRGWNPSPAGPPEDNIVKVVNDQFTPDQNTQVHDLVPMQCQGKRCPNSKKN
jgi:hypothetical protein